MADHKPKQPVNPALVEAWLARYRGLGDALEKNPEGEWAWLWRVRRDILHYLLREYGQSVSITDLAESQPKVKPTVPASPESTDSYLHATQRAVPDHGATYPLKKGSDFSDRLARLRSVNEQVRKQHPIHSEVYPPVNPHSRIVRTTYPEDLQARVGLPLDTVHRAVVAAELEGIRRHLESNGHTSGIDEPLAEDDILAILLSDDPAV